MSTTRIGLKQEDFQLIWRIRFRGCWEMIEVRWLPRLTGDVRGSSMELGWLVCLLGAGFSSPRAAERITRTGRCVRGGVCCAPVPGYPCHACHRHGAPFVYFKLCFPCEFFDPHCKVKENSSAQIRQCRMSVFKALQFFGRHLKIFRLCQLEK